MTAAAFTGREPVAIVGMGCRLPGGITSPSGLWEALVQGRDCVARIPEHRWKTMVEHLHPDQVPATPFPAGVVDVDAFDREFFSIGPDEAAEMDPQQKLLLETVYETLADASMRPSSLAGSGMGVYVGAASTDQASINFGTGHRAGVHTGSGAGMAILANRVSFLLDLAGPSLTFDTACSSSLTALHYAVRDLRAGAVETAIVAGTNILTSPIITASFVEAGVLARDGRCRPFDSQAAGYVRSEGTVVLVLTRAAVAQEQGRRVWAHVAGTAIGHGGASQHLLRPRAERQTAVIRQALADAAVHPDRVGWVQAHGTATRAGDRIEAEGIAQALDRDTPVPVGSAKAALGHLEGGAGALGVMVAALAVHHGQIPPTLHHHTLRHRLEGLVRVPTTVQDWPTGKPAEQEGTRVAGVSSFGFGGANAHAIITNAPPLEPPPAQDPMPLPEIVLLSAHNPAALASTAGHLAERTPQGRSVGTVADTALAHGPHDRHRAAVVAADLGTLVQGLRSIQDGAPNADVVGLGCAPDVRPWVVFVYTGHGGHHPDAGAELLRVPAFAHVLHEAREELAEHTGYPVWAPGQGITSFIDAQHCTFLTQVALTALLTDRGITPNAVLGHSVGEIAAAHTAGALPLDSAARVLAHRSRLLSGLAEAGGLLAVRAGVEETGEFLASYDGRVSIASYSAPRVQVVAGSHGDLLHLHTVLDSEGVWSRPVADVIPAHSPAVDPLVPALEQALAGLHPQAPRVPIISTAYPHEDTAEAGMWGPVYWAAQARQPVRFTDALRTAAQDDESEPVVFVEIGPRTLLVEHIAHTVDSSHHTVAVTTDPTGLARAVGELYTRGVTPTGPTHRAHPDLVIVPGWDHTRASTAGTVPGQVQPPTPDGVAEHLTAEVRRLLHLPDGLDMTASWTELGLESHQLLQLTSRLRRVPAWRHVNIQLFLPNRSLSRVVEDLQALLPAATTSAGRPSVLP
ncbi:type I polyketide synthase [Nocardiopsis dassonvillei]|uniref:type I polyketide synthase n=1 Tax=Nocardiopsis dassonvillei TaxID=2014 RepID=UPI0020105BDE|nr:type I polyketide synthase [Nocardiopsis dassonvillei]MCK9872378.1 type I polyketide synthase [Nocardiopsis dassonvillei]